MATFTGTNANEVITPTAISGSVTRDPAGSYPSSLDDIINALGGSDIVSGGTGNDSVTLGSGNDRYIWNLGDDNDTILAGDGTDTAQVVGTASVNLIEIFAQAGYAKVSAGGDTLSAFGAEIVKIQALGGVDQIYVSDLAGTDVERVEIDLGATVGGAPDGAADGVFLYGKTGGDQIVVMADGTGLKVTGLSAEVFVGGGEGGDVLEIGGMNGNDQIDASGAPVGQISFSLFGGAGADTLIGSRGSDRLYGDFDNDTLDGGDGNDSISGGLGNDGITGGSGNDEITGAIGNDTIDGGRGDDDLAGAEGTDTLDGGTSSDILRGGMGDDILKGGKGADQFFFGELDLGLNGLDRIRDFRPGKDSIVFDLLDEIGPKLNKSEFEIGRKAHDGNDHIIYHDKSGIVSYDGDGKGGDAAIAFARIGKHLDLSHKDFDILVS